MRRLAALLGVSLIFIIAAAANRAATTAAGIDVQVGAQCEVPGQSVSGSVSVTGGSFPLTFDVFVTDHVPGEGVFIEIAGSRVTIVANLSPVDFGPLDISNVRPTANTVRVETTLSPAKSGSFDCFGEGSSSPTPKATSSSQATRTAISTRTPRSTGTAGTATGTAGIETATPVPTATDTPQGTVTASATSTQTSVITATGTTQSASGGPTSTSTPVGGNTTGTQQSGAPTAQSTPTLVSVALGSTRPPTNASGGPTALPNAGIHDRSGTIGYLLAIAILALTGGGMWAAYAYRRTHS